MKKIIVCGQNLRATSEEFAKELIWEYEKCVSFTFSPSAKKNFFFQLKEKERCLNILTHALPEKQRNEYLIS